MTALSRCQICGESKILLKTSQGEKVVYDKNQNSAPKALLHEIVLSNFDDVETLFQGRPQILKSERFSSDISHWKNGLYVNKLKN